MEQVRVLRDYNVIERVRNYYEVPYVPDGIWSVLGRIIRSSLINYN